MKTIHFQHEYSIGDKVYHATADSPMGIVTDFRYNAKGNYVEYMVAYSFSPSDVAWCIEEELSDSKTF